MKRITVPAYAKINLFLDVINKRNDGYHNIESVMQSVSLCDEVTVEVEVGEGIEINQFFENSDLPCDETNLCYKAANAYLVYFGIDNVKININVDKRIPCQAGLAGGSADAAAVIRGLDMAFGKTTDTALLSKIGLMVGSDVGFCIYGGTCAVEGRGEIVKPIAKLEKYWVVIAKSNSESVSTSVAYSRIDSNEKKTSPKIMFSDYVDAVIDGNNAKVESGMYNLFQDVMKDELTDTYEIIGIMKKNGSLGAQMSGSGPSVFGLFDCEEKARVALKALEERCFAAVCRMV